MNIRRSIQHVILQYAALVSALLLVVIQPAPADTTGSPAPSTAVSLNEVASGRLLFQTATAGAYQPAIQLESRAEFTISGLVATVDVVQKFRNTTREWAEGVYVFPLPETAAVNAMEIRLGERRIMGEIREKQQARQEYRKAKVEGRRTALLEQRRPNLFATAVANIAPGETIEVRLTYIETVRFAHGRFRLRFPMTVTPRYMPGNPNPGAEQPSTIAPGTGWADATDQVDDAASISPWQIPRRANPAQQDHTISISATLDAGLPLANVTSAYHDLHLVRNGDIYEIELASGTVPMDRDFELSWTPVPANAPRTAVFTETHAGETWALAMIMPPARNRPARRLPRETIFVIDTSGSMGGEPFRAARNALDLALTRLHPADRFNIIAFSDTPHKLFNNSHAADAENLARAQHWVSRLDAGGGTEMLAALHAALDDTAEDTDTRLRQIIFITDGAVGNEDALFRAITHQLGNSRLFTVGIGAAPNAHFMRRAAHFGRGTFTYVGTGGEIATGMNDLFAALEYPMLRNLHIEWPGHQRPLFSPDPVPDLYAGEPLIITAKLAGTNGQLVVSGDTADGEWRQAVSLPTGVSHRGVASLWARDQITRIDDQIAMQGETRARRARMLNIALRHRLVSRYTSFLAIEQRITRPPNVNRDSHDIPNLRPAGQSPQTFAWPQTATGATAALWLGLLGFAATLLLWFRVMNCGTPPVHER